MSLDVAVRTTNEINGLVVKSGVSTYGEDLVKGCVVKNKVEESQNPAKPDRRKVIKTLGKFGVFTAPALTVLLARTEAAPGSPL